MRTYLIIFFNILLSYGVFGQISIIGKSIDNVTKEPVGDVSVMDNKGNLLTKANSEGIFVLSEVKSLPVSINLQAVGYNSVILLMDVKTDTTLVYLSRAEILMEEIVVSTGYQKIPKERATGSYSFISNEDLKQKNSSRIMDRIEDMATGIFANRQNYNINMPHNNPEYLIHGISSILSSSSPLIVVDGFPYEGNINEINPNDVKDISILKDAAASSIWGARAGNGVIVINTNKGDSGTLKVNFNQSYEFSKAPNLFKAPYITSSDFIDLEIFLYDQGYYKSEFTKANKPAITPVVQLLYDKETGKVGDSEFEATVTKWKQLDVRRDFLKYIYRNPMEKQSNLNLQGGNGKISYYLGAGYFGSDQTLKTNKSRRYNIRNNNTFKLNKRIEVQSLLALNNTIQYTYPVSASAGYGNIRMGAKVIYPYAQFLDDQNNPLAVPNLYRQSYLDELSTKGLLNWDYVPVQELEFNSLKNKALSTQVGVKGIVNVWKGIDLSMDYQYQLTVSEGLSNYSTESFYARNLVNRYSAVSADGSLIRNIPEGAIQDRNNGRKSSSAFRSQLDYDFNIDGIHSILGLVGFEVRDVRDDIYSSRNYGFDESNYDFQYVDYLTRFPIFDKLAANSLIPRNDNIKGLHNRFVSLYGNFAYSYRNSYNITASFRKDASNLFGVKTNQKWSPFWSLGVSADLLAGWYHGALIDRLKIRTTIGYSGNIDPSRSALLRTRRGGYDSNTGNLFYAIESPPDYHMRWEKVRTINVGLDFGFWNNRLFGSVDVYRKNTKDLFGYEPLDPTTGFSYQFLNRASTQSSGVDFELITTVGHRAIRWQPALKVSYIKNVLNSYNTTSNNSATLFIPTPYIEGEVLRPLVSLPFHGLEAKTGDPIGFYHGANSTDYSSIVNNLSVDELVIHGSQLPQKIVAFSHRIKYQEFALFLNFTGQFDYFFRRSGFTSSGIATMEIHSDYSRRWQKEGDELLTTIPSFKYPINNNRDTFYRLSEDLIEPGDHIRLQDIRLSYHLDRLFRKNIGLEIYSNLNNVWLVWKKTKIDVDPMTAASWIPAQRNYSIGLNLKF